jgi:hypothetical protein
MSPYNLLSAGELPRDLIDSVFDFLETNDSIWIHDYKNNELLMKINKQSTFIQNLKTVVMKKIHKPTKEKIIQIMDEDGIIKTLNVYTSYFEFNSDIINPMYSTIEYYLCEYSVYFKPVLKNNEIVYEKNYIIIIKNNNDWDHHANIEYPYGYGAVMNGYHYYNEGVFMKETKLDEEYIGYASSYRTFPTVNNAQLYEFN